MIDKTAQDISISIPAAIATLPLPLNERVAVAYLHEFPACSNGGLARLLGIKVRSVEDMLRRLRSAGYIRLEGVGRARKHELTFPVPTDTVGENQPDESHVSRGSTDTEGSGEPATPGDLLPAQPTDYMQDWSFPDYAEFHFGAAQTCVGYARWNDVLSHYRQIRERAAGDASIPPEQKEFVYAELTEREDRVLALRLGWESSKKLPKKKRDAIVKLVCEATREQLAQFRQRLEQNAKLGHALEVLALPSPDQRSKQLAMRTIPVRVATTSQNRLCGVAKPTTIQRRSQTGGTALPATATRQGIPVAGQIL